MVNVKIFIWVIGAMLLTFVSCSEEGGVNVFTLEQDIELGEQMDSLIQNTPEDYNVLPRTGNEEAYRYIDGLLTHILSSDEIIYGDEFDWEVTIIDDDVLNAFACPGGKLYFYTGIIEYLENAAQFAGVMAHEVAHADRRHSTKMLTKQYGLSILVSVLVDDDASQLAEIASNLATGLVGLQFSRDNEYEADEYSVKYLANGSTYYAKGIRGFFELIEANGETSETFEFLSTHPNDDNRKNNIDEVYDNLPSKGASSSATFIDGYNDFKSMLDL